MTFPYDSAYKLSSDEDVYGTLTLLAGVQLDPGAVVESLDRELNLERLHADQLCRVRTGSRECIHDLEALTGYRSDWGESQLDHAIFAQTKYRLPLYSHLILLHSEGVPAHIPQELHRVSGGLEQRLQVNIIRLWTRPAAEVLASGRVALYPWTALMDATVEQQREAVRRILEAGDPGLESQMAVLGSLRYGSREAFLERVGKMLLTKKILSETPMWKEIQADTKRDDLRHVLSSRFGPLPEWAESKLTQADHDTLHQWLGRAGVADTLQAAIN